MNFSHGEVQCAREIMNRSVQTTTADARRQRQKKEINMDKYQDNEEPLAEVANTREHEEALWNLHMAADAAPLTEDACPRRLSQDGQAVLDIIGGAVDAEDVAYISVLLREVADYLDHWRSGPGTLLLPS
jgi:hypothetical protein